MSQSIMRNYLHITFSTKHRQPFIDAKIESELHNYIGGICNKFDSQPLIVGGHIDHVHILCMLSKKTLGTKLLEEVKSHSSKWAKTNGPEYENFYGQDGYAAFSVNPSETDKVIGYILNQKEHHKKVSFQDEYRAFLKKYKVEYDERYVWD